MSEVSLRDTKFLKKKKKKTKNKKLTKIFPV